MLESQNDWYIDDVNDDNGYSFREYDVTSTPNDFNTKTIIDFIESGLFKIPGFQRNYVWDIKRASKLIESIIIGLPIPQVFLYEESRNNDLVIDGQQRLLTIFFFSKKRFPKVEKRFELRQIFDDNNSFPDEILHNDSYFEDFKLVLTDPSNPNSNKLNGLSYPTLGELRSGFDLRTVRNIMIKQNLPSEDDSAMFEIFNRLNSGGVILKPQEIRTSLYHSKFYNQLYKLNLYENWRLLLGKQEPDIHMKDVEILLRGFSLLLESNKYKAPMNRFLNHFSKKSREFKEVSLEYFRELFENFCDYVEGLDRNIFFSKTGKFSITIFESIFVALCKDAVDSKTTNIKQTTLDRIALLKSNEDFNNATQDNTAGKKNVDIRLQLAKDIL